LPSTADGSLLDLEDAFAPENLEHQVSFRELRTMLPQPLARK
jgi:hypothetical protein